ncbi:vanillate O-demethylase ferredoxin subunit [Paraburkholderia sp. BL6665CI2N2]|uniref:PDR/VanB family oxidoreductase n=1 Tax=Paraburkholderia sp. BL6665CI2N2 TaxID=1938806 RepID=UPI0010EC7F90|nr:PDR/VanB family oxidoreductase [Paraburkholderia sp. BL6665CI2N2]TDY15487.1 vanillate O-demethylase ferredoxin subunit [Paraburkholderia sp. BL6665CI2N2]
MNAVALHESPLVRQEPIAPSKLQVRVQAVSYLADDINQFEFVSVDSDTLPAFTPGSHIDVHLPDGSIRQYSLCNPSTERHRYVIAVLRDPLGRGGSVAMHDVLRAGQIVTVSAPRNHFALSTSATKHLFIAGGIGITPIMSMIAEVQRRGEAFHLHYCARTPQRTAFTRELCGLVASGLASIHYDNGDPSKGLDLNATLQSHPDGAHLYYCGPAGLMDAIEVASAHWSRDAVHYERFSATGTPVRTAGDDPEQPFDVELARSNKRFTVHPGETIVDALKLQGVEVDTSCCEGYCGTCMTRYLSGDPLHRDSVLDEDDRAEFIMICCSRAKSGSLVLDL